MDSENLRGAVLEWSEQQILRPEHTERALRIAGLIPQAAEWRVFVRALLLWAGVVLAASGVIFFVAFNWQAMGRFFRFGLIEVLLLAVVLIAWRLGAGSAGGQATITGAALLTGALLALIGQTYQTGADPYELFGIWALLILPWVAVARFDGLCMLWIVLAETAIGLYYGRFGFRNDSVLFGRDHGLYVLFVFHGVMLIGWEAAARAGATWLRRWGALVLAVWGTVLATFLGAVGIADSDSVGILGLPAYLVWTVAVYVYYRRVVLEVVPLACWVLSVIVVLTTFLGKNIDGGAGGLFLIGLMVLGLSGSGAWWIRQVLQEKRA